VGVRNHQGRACLPAKARADAVLKIKEFTIVNDCFQYKSNEEIGVIWGALIICHLLTAVILTIFETIKDRII